jgi:zinc protease
MGALLLLATAALAQAPEGWEQRSFELDNGMRVLLLADDRAPLVSVQLLVAAGARDDPEGLAGTAHLLEHAMFTGTQRLPGQGFDLELEALGGDANAWTHYDWTGFVTTVPPGALERTLALEAERLAHPSLDPAAVAVQQRVVRAEALGSLSTPHGLDAPVLAELLYPGAHPYGRDVMGVGGPRGAPDLAAVDAEILRAFHREHYAPGRCVLALAGDLDLDRTEAWVRAGFGAIPARRAAPRGAEIAGPLAGERRVWLPADVGSAGLLMAWRGVPMGHPEEPALAVLAWLLSHGAWAQRLEARGQVTELQAWSDAWQLGGGFVVSLRSEQGELEPLQRAVDAELLRLARRGPDAGQLERARGAWLNRWLRAADPVQGRGSLGAQCLARALPPDCADAELERFLAVQPADIQRAARALVDAPGRVLLSVASEWDYERSLPGSEPAVLP